jgi:FlaA1/EpsC-like NDP-sugar epimerase
MGGRSEAQGLSAALAPEASGRSWLEGVASGLVARDRGLLPMSIDGLAWAGGLWLAVFLRFNFAPPEPYVTRRLWALVAMALAAQVGVGLSSGLYRRRWRLGSFEEVAALVWAAAGATVAVFLFNWLSGPRGGTERLEPASLPLSGGLVALTGMLAVRYCWRARHQRRSRPDASRAQRVLVFGAGEAGASLVRAMLSRCDSPYLPVGLLDDNPRRSNLTICGVPVLGSRSCLAQASSRVGATAVVVAVPSAGPALLREICALADRAGLEVKALPGLHELVDGAPRVSDVRTPTLGDLLGRRPVRTDLEAIASYLTARRVLVTGAGGSIGSELCRQIRRFHPAQLVMVDRDESALHALQLSMEGRALLDDPDLVLLDIRDGARLRALFDEVMPEVVFHAAALKHLPVLEVHPGEAVKTNVWATASVLEEAARVGVGRFVNVSTDKAANPTSVLGFTKRIGERMTAAVDSRAVGTFLSVRFGNVLGSRGSVLTTFQAQVASGGPVTVTHPDVTRYLMTVEEAVGLVIQAGAIGRGGEVLVLDMGEPVRIADLARRMAAEAGAEVDIVYTGLRPGEKLAEVLFGDGEWDCRPVHPLISHVAVPSLPPEATGSLDPSAPPGKLREAVAAVTFLNLEAGPLPVAGGLQPSQLLPPPAFGLERHSVLRTGSGSCGHSGRVRGVGNGASPP